MLNLLIIGGNLNLRKSTFILHLSPFSITVLKIKSHFNKLFPGDPRRDKL